MECPGCRRQYPGGTGFCAEDGQRLAPREAPSSAGPTRPEPRADPLIGRTLEGRYQIVERIGVGGMGAVYRARQLNVDRDVAIKVLLGAGLVDPKLVQRFEDEARIISRLRHPGLLKLIDVGWVEEGAPFFVTELLHGQSLQAALAAGPMTEARALRIALALADALVEPHAQGIIHRDIKPANVFLEQIGDRELVKLLDFGVAMFQEGSARTTTGNVLGTPKYMSPEQATGEGVGPASDLYTLGVLLFECLTGRVPFVSTVPAALLLKHITEAPAKPSSLVALSAETEALVLSLLAKTPAGRPAGARELSRTIEGLLRERPEGGVAGGPRAAGTPGVVAASGAGSAAVADDTPVWSRRAGGDTAALAEPSGVERAPQRAGRGAWIAGGAVVVATLVAGGWWAVSGPAGDGSGEVRGAEARGAEARGTEARGAEAAVVTGPAVSGAPGVDRSAASARTASAARGEPSASGPPASASPASAAPVPKAAVPARRPPATPARSPRRSPTATPTATPTAIPTAPPTSPTAPPTPTPSLASPSPTPKAPAGYVPVLTR